MLAGVDAYWVFQKQRGQMQLTVQGRDIEGDEYAVQFDKETARWKMLGPTNQVIGSAFQNVILSALERSGKPMRWGDLKEVSKLGGEFNASLARLVERNHVEQDANGRYRSTAIEM